MVTLAEVMARAQLSRRDVSSKSGAMMSAPYNQRVPERRLVKARRSQSGALTERVVGLLGHLIRPR
jgi:hypothetical protein